MCMRVATENRTKTDWDVALAWTTYLTKQLAWYLPLGYALYVPTFFSKLYGQSLFPFWISDPLDVVFCDHVLTCRLVPYCCGHMACSSSSFLKDCYVSCFLIAVAKHPIRSHLREEAFVRSYSLRGCATSWWRRYRCRNRSSSGHTTSTVRHQRGNRKWGWAIEPQGWYLGSPFFRKSPTPLGLHNLSQ